MIEGVFLGLSHSQQYYDGEMSSFENVTDKSYLKFIAYLVNLKQSREPTTIMN